VLVRRLDRTTRLPLVLAFPLLWTALEYFRDHFGTGFPWYLLGHTQHDFLHLIQIADLGGAFAVSFLVVAVNVVAFETLSRWAVWRQFVQLPEPHPKKCCRSLVVQGACVALLLGAGVMVSAFGSGLPLRRFLRI